MARSIPAAAVERTHLHIAEYKRLRALTAELAEVNDQLCQALPVQGKPVKPRAVDEPFQQVIGHLGVAEPQPEGAIIIRLSGLSSYLVAIRLAHSHRSNGFQPRPDLQGFPRVAGVVASLARNSPPQS